MFSIVGVVQKYAWGKKGNQSEVARLYSKSSENCDVEENCPYAELWLGTHIKAPSKVEKSGEELSVWLKTNTFHDRDNLENCINLHSAENGKTFKSRVDDSSDGQLPFLLKVLSIDKSLSIQIHPNKSEAFHLHAKDPSNYPDANHKPEMTIALTPFEALCSFRPLSQVLTYIQEIEELRELVTRNGEVEQKGTKSELQIEHFFKNLMTSDKQNVLFLADKLYQRINKNDTPTAGEKLFMRLMDQHRGDVGCFCAFFLNHITLAPGQSLFLSSNLPHAYISGDCIECMACSDNVIRAGLTGKFRDVEALCRLVEYTPMTPSQVLFTPTSSPTHPAITIYNPPVPEFGVHKIELSSPFEAFALPKLPSHSILLVIRGKVKVTSDQIELVISRGKSIFVKSQYEVTLSPVIGEGNGGGNDDYVLIFRAFSTG